MAERTSDPRDRLAGSGSVVSGAPEWVGHQPVPLTSIVGRDEDARALRALLLRDASRLVTLTGPAGVGKTRLAIEVAAGLDGGFDAVAFVPLASIDSPDLVMSTIARTVGVEPADEPTTGALAGYLGARTTLLVLDNFEHLLGAGPHLVELLGVARGLTVLVTSRAVIRVSGEQVVTLPPLTLPADGPLPNAAALGEYGALRLFEERAQAVRPGFCLDDENAAVVVEICRCLDGLPLAIELAAARITVLPPGALLERLSHRLELLTDGAQDQPERLQTLRAGIAWSYDLLSADERSMFRTLSVFVGGCTLAAAESVSRCRDTLALDVVSALVDKSLLQRLTDVDGEPRLAMLETVREFAAEQLAGSADEIEVRREHAAYFRGLAEGAEPGLRGPRQQHWRDVLEAELANFRAALEWTLGRRAPEDAATGVLLVGSLWYFWFQRGLTEEARRWLALALAVAAPGKARAQALLGAGTLAWRQGECDVARAHLDESVSLWRAEEDRQGLAEAIHVLGHVRFDQRDYGAARSLFEESFDEYDRAHDTMGGLPLIGDLGLVAYHEGDYRSADRILRESLALYRKHRLKDRVAGALNLLGDLAQLAGNSDRATALYEESLALWRELRGAPGIASALHKLGQVSQSRHDSATARARLVASLALQQELGNKQGIAECLAGLAATADASGHPKRAARLFAASSAILDAIGVPLAPVDLKALTHDMGITRNRLGPQTWKREWAAGLALTTEDAIRVALVDDDTRSSNETDPAREAPVPSRLSPRERHVCRLIAQGLTNREIARTLAISEKTVGSHVDHIMTKLDLRSRTRIAVWAVQHELGPSAPC